MTHMRRARTTVPPRTPDLGRPGRPGCPSPPEDGKETLWVACEEQVFDHIERSAAATPLTGQAPCVIGERPMDCRKQEWELAEARMG
ncbi:hypothetical protein Scel_20920 [Streptomyces cellostaticus]|nr:hypothetical protein Scel_20920 [Streptomyces cellostaticus]